MATSWQEYQEEVAEFFRDLGVDVTTNARRQGVRTTHDIDVFVRSHHVGFDVVWLVECKCWSTPVNKLHVLGLRQIVADLGADRGILLCETGFQSGALEAAKLTNVHLTSLTELRGKARADFQAMQLREIIDRTETCRVRYWDIPKNDRIESGLRHAVGLLGYSGNVVIEAASELLGKALRGRYPIACDSIYAFRLFGAERQFADLSEILSTVEPMIKDLEMRLESHDPKRS